MGHGIAQVCAGVGCQVTLYDVDDVAAARGLDRIRANLDKGVELGKLTASERDTTLPSLKRTPRKDSLPSPAARAAKYCPSDWSSASIASARRRNSRTSPSTSRCCH